MSFLVTDIGGGANEPIALLTGDFIFVGDVGRPDLLESAAVQAGAMEPRARTIYTSLRKSSLTPDSPHASMKSHPANRSSSTSAAESVPPLRRRFSPHAATTWYTSMVPSLRSQPD